MKQIILSIYILILLIVPTVLGDMVVDNEVRWVTQLQNSFDISDVEGTIIEIKYGYNWFIDIDELQNLVVNITNVGENNISSNLTTMRLDVKKDKIYRVGDKIKFSGNLSVYVDSSGYIGHSKISDGYAVVKNVSIEILEASKVSENNAETPVLPVVKKKSLLEKFWDWFNPKKADLLKQTPKNDYSNQNIVITPAPILSNRGGYEPFSQNCIIVDVRDDSLLVKILTDSNGFYNIGDHILIDLPKGDGKKYKVGDIIDYSGYIHLDPTLASADIILVDNDFYVIGVVENFTEKPYYPGYDNFGFYKVFNLRITEVINGDYKVGDLIEIESKAGGDFEVGQKLARYRRSVGENGYDFTIIPINEDNLCTESRPCVVK